VRDITNFEQLNFYQLGEMTGETLMPWTVGCNKFQILKNHAPTFMSVRWAGTENHVPSAIDFHPE
jgi:hypothetical protein